MHCKAGKVPLAFMIWKSLPNPGLKKLKQKGMKFESGLVKMINKNLKLSYERFKDKSNEGNNKKKYAVRKLILVTMSDSNRYFNKWRKVSSEIKITEKMLALTKFFEQSTAVFTENMHLFDNFHQESEKRLKAVEIMNNNVRINLSWVLSHWRNTIKD